MFRIYHSCAFDALYLLSIDHKQYDSHHMIEIIEYEYASCHNTANILGIDSSNERRRYYLTLSLAEPIPRKIPTIYCTADVA